MTVKKKKKSTSGTARTVTVACSLCLLAIITMIGMYTVGRTDQQQQQLEEQVAQAEDEVRLQQEEYQKAQEEKQAAASASAQRQKEEQAESETAELESEFLTEDSEESIAAQTLQPASAGAQTVVQESVQTETQALSFSADTDTLLWPVAGNIILDYSMDKSVYFTTLDQYKYNPAVIIQGSVNDSVMCGAPGRVSEITTLEETGTTVTVDIGSGYELIYGQLKELPVKEGDYLKAGETIGYISEPTKYYVKEGSNVYFEIRKDGESIDPMTLLQ
jgi:septal ring factor EnvC (AmiA/AmiB activator)